MVIRYKYPNENEVILQLGFSHEISTAYDRDRATEFRGIGTYTNVSTGGIFGFSTVRFTNTSFSEIVSKYLITEQTFYRTFSATERYPIYTLFGLSLASNSDEFIYSTLNFTTVSLSMLRNAILTNTPLPPNSSYNNQDTNVNPGYGLLVHWDKPRTPNGGSYAYWEDPITRNLNPTITEWLPMNGITRYTLNIYDASGTSIFTRTEDYLPEYVEAGKVCPDNTCPVICGEHICCYGSDGIARESFLLSESVYQ